MCFSAQIPSTLFVWMFFLQITILLMRTRKKYLGIQIMFEVNKYMTSEMKQITSSMTDSMSHKIRIVTHLYLLSGFVINTWIKSIYFVNIKPYNAKFAQEYQRYWTDCFGIIFNFAHSDFEAQIKINSCEDFNRNNFSVGKHIRNSDNRPHLTI